jgi:hypothetical protein
MRIRNPQTIADIEYVVDPPSRGSDLAAGQPVASRAAVTGIAIAGGIIRSRLSFFTFTTTHGTRVGMW